MRAEGKFLFTVGKSNCVGSRQEEEEEGTVPQLPLPRLYVLRLSGTVAERKQLEVLVAFTSPRTSW